MIPAPEVTRAERKTMEEKTKLEARYWLSDHKYIAALSDCLAVVTVDKKGKIIRVVTFGERRKENAIK